MPEEHRRFYLQLVNRLLFESHFTTIFYFVFLLGIISMYAMHRPLELVYPGTGPTLRVDVKVKVSADQFSPLETIYLAPLSISRVPVRSWFWKNVSALISPESLPDREVAVSYHRQEIVVPHDLWRQPVFFLRPSLDMVAKFVSERPTLEVVVWPLKAGSGHTCAEMEQMSPLPSGVIALFPKF